MLCAVWASSSACLWAAQQLLSGSPPSRARCPASCPLPSRKRRPNQVFLMAMLEMGIPKVKAEVRGVARRRRSQELKLLGTWEEASWRGQASRRAPV
jgi:hypothetical protein